MDSLDDLGFVDRHVGLRYLVGLKEIDARTRTNFVVHAFRFDGPNGFSGNTELSLPHAAGALHQRRVNRRGLEYGSIIRQQKAR